MRYAACIFVALCLCGISSDEIVFRAAHAGGPATAGETDWGFLRADANSDLLLNINDASFLTNYLFSGGPAPGCMAAADVNNDNSVDVTDVSYLTNYLFNGGPAPSDPFPDCDWVYIDDWDNFIGCEATTCDV